MHCRVCCVALAQRDRMYMCYVLCMLCVSSSLSCEVIYLCSTQPCIVSCTSVNYYTIRTLMFIFLCSLMVRDSRGGCLLKVVSEVRRLLTGLLPRLRKQACLLRLCFPLYHISSHSLQHGSSCVPCNYTCYLKSCAYMWAWMFMLWWAIALWSTCMYAIFIQILAAATVNFSPTGVRLLIKCSSYLRAALERYLLVILIR